MFPAIADNFCSSLTWKISVNFTVFLSNVQGAGLDIMLMKNNKVSPTPNKLGKNSLLQDLVASNNVNLRSTLSPSQPLLGLSRNGRGGALRDDPNNGCEGD